MQSARLSTSPPTWPAARTDIAGAAVVLERAPDGTPADGIRKLALDIRGLLPADRPGVVVIVGVPADRPTVVVTVNEAGRARGLAAGALVQAAAGALGGRGGGKDDVAQGGGTPLGENATQVIEESFRTVRTVIRDVAASSGVP